MSQDSNCHWSFHPFTQISTRQLYKILQLRAEVFVVEQNCVYQDMDDYDDRAIHCCGILDHSLVAYARIFAPGDKHTSHSSIGRIVTHRDYRGQSLGKELVKQCTAYCREHHPHAAIHISAQCYLDRFYTELGFRKISEVYLEDGIDHQEMLFEF